VRICLISVEIFAWGKYGGFGRATRVIGRELARRGHDVFAVVPRRADQRPEERLDGITVLGFPARRPWAASELFRRCDAELYHSCEPSFGSYLALRAMPRRRHVATFRDPRDLRDWSLELALPSLSRLQVLQNFAYENNPLVRRAVRAMDATFTTAEFLVPKARRLYRLDYDPDVLPTPIPLPARVAKAAEPTVCYLARLDRRKRPELFLDLAARYPKVRFIVMGAARDPRYEAALRARYAGAANLEFAGFVDQFRSERYAELLGQSWVLVNPAAREGLPNAFLEAWSYECAVLSAVDPGGLVTRFGACAADDDFGRGLVHLLEKDRWRERGRAGAAYVRERYETSRAIDLHLEAYARVLKNSRSPARARR
jgi:glycosyltransferase involved in cell wall biosynthesis